MTYGSAGVPPATGGATPARRRDDLGRSGVALLIVGSLFTLLSAVSLWSWRTFASSEGFADVATDTLKEPAVTEVVADQIVKILQDQVSIFVNFQDEPQQERRDDRPSIPLNDNLFRSVDELEFSVRSQNCLQNADIKYIGELVQKSEQEMLKTKNFGHKSLNEIKEILREMGLELGMKIDHFPPREEIESRRRADEKETA